MDMFSGIDNEIVMDVQDYIREKCGDNIANHIEFYISFYEKISAAYDDLNDFDDEKQIDNFTWAVIHEL